MTNREMIKKIKIELSGMPNMEFMAGYKVVSVGTKWVTWTDRRAETNRSAISDFYRALTSDVSIYSIINGSE